MPLQPNLRLGEKTLSTEVQGPDDIKEPVEETENISPDLAALAVAGPFTPQDEVREVKPFFFLDNAQDNPIKDFRGVATGRVGQPDLVPVVEEEVSSPDPKDSSAPESVESLSSTEQEQTDNSSESSASQEKTAPVEKDSGKPKESEKSGTPVF